MDLFPLIWSVRSKLFYGTIVLVKYGWSTWRSTKNGALTWMPKFWWGSLDTSDKPNWSVGRGTDAIIVTCFTLKLRIWGKTMQNRLLIGRISSISLPDGLSATITLNFASISINLNNIWSFPTSTWGTTRKESSGKWESTKAIRRSTIKLVQSGKLSQMYTSSFTKNSKMK